MKLLLEGKAMLDVDVISGTVLRARTPPASPGPADLTLGLVAGDLLVRGAYSYYQSTSPTYGGMGGGPVSGTLRWTYAGARASLAEMRLYHNDKTPIWRILVNGSVTEVKLPDPATSGLPPWPSGSYVWYQYLAHLPSYSFNTFNYLHVYSVFWDRWSADRSTLKIP